MNYQRQRQMAVSSAQSELSARVDFVDITDTLKKKRKTTNL